MSDAVDLKRRRLLQLVALAPFAWQARRWVVRPPDAFAQTLPDDPTIVPTLEAFADTLIPGEKRSSDDRAIAGAAAGPGAVQAGALDLMNFPPVGVAPALPGFAAGLNAHAVQYVADPTYTWDKLRAEQPGKYEQPVTPAPDPNGWFHVRVVVASPKVSVFVADATEPSLVVSQLSHRAKGRVGLWVGNGSDGDFANLILTPSPPLR